MKALILFLGLFAGVLMFAIMRKKMTAPALTMVVVLLLIVFLAL